MENHPCEGCYWWTTLCCNVGLVNKGGWNPHPTERCAQWDLNGKYITSFETQEQNHRGTGEVSQDTGSEPVGSDIRRSESLGSHDSVKRAVSKPRPGNSAGHRKQRDTKTDGDTTDSHKKRTKRIHEDGSVLSEQGTVP